MTNAETDRPGPTEAVTPAYLRESAAHLATQFGTEVPVYKDLMAAANALQDGDRAKAERILGVKFQP